MFSSSPYWVFIMHLLLYQQPPICCHKIITCTFWSWKQMLPIGLGFCLRVPKNTYKMFVQLIFYGIQLLFI